MRQRCYIPVYGFSIFALYQGAWSIHFLAVGVHPEVNPVIDSRLPYPAVNHFCILGAPGSGKTTALVGRIAKAVGETGYGGDIVICSLTRTAAHEIAERVKAKVPCVEFPHVGTVHALALRAMKAIGDSPRLVYEPEHIKDFNETYNRRLPLSLGSTLYDPEEAKGTLKVMADMDRRRAAMQPVDEWPASTTQLYNQWSAWKDSTGLLDFTDLIHRAIRTCKVHPANPRYIFVDEAQDLSKLEMMLITQWAETTEKTIIAGDDQQALYEWRGASVRDFIDFALPENQYVLPRSYRMSQAVYDKARSFGDRISLKIEKDFEPVGDGGVVVKRQAVDLLSNLKRDLVDPDVGSVMLLASCGYMLNPYLKELRRAGTPFHNPYRSRAEGKTWNPLKTNYADAFRCFLMPSEGQQMWTWQQLWRVVQHLDPEKLGGIREGVSKHKGVRQIVPDEWVDEQKAEELLKAAKAGDYHAWFDMMTHSAKYGSTPSSVSPMSYIKRVLDAHGRRALDVKPKLVVGTIHSVKGGEADVVYVLPTISPEANRNRTTRAGRDSLLRTFYVGTSRARHKLVLVSDPKNARRSMWV